MWIDCEKISVVIWFIQVACENNSSHILTHIVRRLWENCECRWIPLLRLIFRVTYKLTLKVTSRPWVKRNTRWLAKANLQAVLQAELIVLIKNPFCLSVAFVLVTKQMTSNRWIMVRSALFFCRNERADAHWLA